MADIDEDAFPSIDSTQPNPNNDDEGEDETQDFRLIAALSGGSKNSQGQILKRGEKDFEPNPTQHQASVLDESRQAMQDALSFVRSQSGKNHNVGNFVDSRDSGNPWDAKLREHLVGQDWEDRCVVIYRFKSTFGRTFGRADSRSWTWLLPEEALFLLERGTLDIRWPDLAEEDEDIATDEALAEPVGQLPMSLQAAYATFVGRSGLNMDRWLVYSGLRRIGYVVQRAPSWYAFEENVGNGHAHHNTHNRSTTVSTPVLSTPSLISRLLRFITNPRLGTSCPSHGPLLAPGLHRSYGDIYRALSLIQYQTSPTSTCPDPPTTPHGPYSIAYHVWRPSSPFKKTTPPPPDFRICVLDARATNVPTLTEIGTLLDSMPADELPVDKRAEMKIKHGKRNVILAVVDIGVVSYLRLADAAMGDHKIYEGKLARGQKGGRRGGGGRGGGRGRGGARGGGAAGGRGGRG